MADGTPIGALAVRIGADASELINEFAKASAAASKHSTAIGKSVAIYEEVRRVSERVVTALARATAETLLNADATYKAAQAAGVATTTFSELAYAASLSGVSSEQLGVAISRLNRNLADAASGTGESGAAFRALGIQVTDVGGQLKSADAIMAEIANKFANFADGPEKSALAIAIFGRAGAQMIPMLNQGARGLAEMREEARQLGITIDSQTGKAAEEFNDNVERLGKAAHGVANQLMQELLPNLTAVADAAVQAAKSTGGFHDNVKELADSLSTGALVAFQTIAVVGSDLAFVFKQMGGEIGVIAAQLALFARGDFKGARFIGEQWTKDSEQARKDLDEFQAHVMQVQKLKPVAAGGSMDTEEDPTGMRHNRAPVLDKGAQAEAERVAKQLQEGEDEWQKTLAEAYAATTHYRDLQLAKDKDYVDSKNKVMMDAADAAEELAIKDGAIMQANDDASHTARLDALLKANDEAYAENERYRLAVEDLNNNFSDAELEQLGGIQSVKEKMEQEHQQRLLRIKMQAGNTAVEFTRASWQAQAKTIFGELANITAGVTQHNRTLFELNKVAGIANAIIAAYEGIALTMSKYPYPFNLVMAAAHGIAAFAQVQAIRNTSFDSGGAAPSIAGSTPAPAVSDVGTSGGASGGGGNRGTTVINLVGDQFGRKQVRGLLENLNDAFSDGGKLIIAGGS